MSAADRLLRLLVAAYNGAPNRHWTDDTLAQLLSGVGYADKSLESWLRDGFFAQHCKLFRHRPFIWHVWDGLRDGFAALVNYHKLDSKLLETLIYTYLGDWISRQKQDIASGVDGAEEKLAAAEALKARLELILKGEAPYDIFVRWKPLAEQPIGWAPDLNDGVRLNIRPFMSVPGRRPQGRGRAARQAQHRLGQGPRKGRRDGAVVLRLQRRASQRPSSEVGGEARSRKASRCIQRRNRATSFHVSTSLVYLTARRGRLRPNCPDRLSRRDGGFDVIHGQLHPGVEPAPVEAAIDAGVVVPRVGLRAVTRQRGRRKYRQTFCPPSKSLTRAYREHHRSDAAHIDVPTIIWGVTLKELSLK